MSRLVKIVDSLVAIITDSYHVIESLRTDTRIGFMVQAQRLVFITKRTTARLELSEESTPKRAPMLTLQILLITRIHSGIITQDIA